MRRIIHNTTAIAACLSLVAPHLAMAQTATPDAGAQQPAQEQQQPATTEVDANDVAPPAETCDDGSQPPCGEGVTGQAAPEGETAGEEPTDEQSSSVDQPEADAGPTPSVPAETAADAAATEMPAEQPETEPAPANSADAAQETDPAPAAVDAATATEGSDADPVAQEQATEGKPLAETSGDGDEMETPVAEPEADQPAADAEVTQEPPADIETETDAEATGAAAVPVASPTADPAGEAEAIADPATDVDALADALADSSAETEGATDATTEADAGADSSAATATDTASDEQPDSTTDPEQQTQDSADAAGDGDGAVTTAAPTETEAAREAAAASEASTAAALDDDAQVSGVTEEDVTEENSRSSSEDFATDLQDALSEATGQTSAASTDQDDDDDDRSDLAKALLLGLGGLAVGSMLANNREVALSTPDRVVVTRSDGSQELIKDDVALFRQPGSTVTNENFSDGSSRTIVTRADGSKIVTIRDADLRVLRRTLVSADGTSVRLIDDTTQAEPVDIANLPAPATAIDTSVGELDETQLRDALMRQPGFDRTFTLSQIRDIPQVRALVAPIEIDAITFDTGSSAIKSDQAQQLSSLGKVIRDAVAENPREMFLIEGHTDTVGSDAANLALSDRRAESVALALTEYFQVPPENMVVQGYGEQFPKVEQEGDVRENRRATVRRITNLMQTAQN